MLFYFVSHTQHVTTQKEQVDKKQDKVDLTQTGKTKRSHRLTRHMTKMQITVALMLCNYFMT